MRLCMFSPAEADLKRGWPGRIEGDRVVQLAAQTLQSFFTGGSSAREHAEYPLADVLLRAPVLEPPAVRLFEDAGRFSFANPSAIRSPGAFVTRPRAPRRGDAGGRGDRPATARSAAGPGSRNGARRSWRRRKTVTSRSCSVRSWTPSWLTA